MDNRLSQLIELTDFQELFNKYNYAYFTNGDYNVNIIGIRNLIDGPYHKNDFNDALVLIYKVNGKWVKHVWEFSTDPGQTELSNPSNSAGTAILVPGQYRSAYALGLHNSKYKALCQRLAPVAVYRDSNKDKILNFDPRTIQSGYWGINIHRAKDNAITELVNNYSAGCQVFKSSKDFDKFIQICELASQKWGNKFTYTLITSNMLTNCVVI